MVKPSTIARTESFCFGLFLSYFLTKSKQVIAKQPGKNEPWAEATRFPTFMARFEMMQDNTPDSLPTAGNIGEPLYLFLAEHRFIYSATVTTIRVAKAENL